METATESKASVGPCRKCAAGSMHEPWNCDGTCSSGASHAAMYAVPNRDGYFVITTGNCYFSAKCRYCGKRWEVDSSG